MKISIVTPTYNVAPYIEQTILSVISQPVAELEYIIIDGKSTDGTLDVIEKYRDRIAAVVSEPDKGTYDAVNKGFALATGDIMAWIGGDDFYTDGALSTVLKAFTRFPEVAWLTSRTTLTANEQGHFSRCLRRGGFSKQAFMDGCFTENINSYGTAFINQESTFWRRSLWEQTGAQVSLEWPLAGDFELWARFFTRSEIAYLEPPLSVFRLRPKQNSRKNYQGYIAEASAILEVYRKQAAYQVPPSRPDGLRQYQGNFISQDALMKHNFFFIDSKGALGALKPAIADNLIG